MTSLKSRQAILKHEWILETMNRYKVLNLPIEPQVIRDIFNIPIQDAKIILKEYNQGKNIAS